MRQLLTGGRMYTPQGFRLADVLVEDGIIVSISPSPTVSISSFHGNVISCNNKMIVPGFADVHVHLREPGFSYKETIETGTRAAAHGGYTAVCSMPNLNPPPDSREHLQLQQQQIAKTAVVHVYPYASITKGQKGEGVLVDFAKLKEAGAIAFSDDGRGVQKYDEMLEAMKQVQSVGGIIAAHCEDETLLHGGYVHDGVYAKEHGHRGICSESEWKQIERDIELVRQTGCRYHVCHISTKEAVQLIRKAKAEGLPVTCETGPHYLVLCDEDLQEDGRFKMNPPLRSREDRAELIKGIQDGTIDMIATDHAPHSDEEKGRGLEKSAMGVVGLETAFAVLNTHLVNKGIITLEKLIELMSINPRKIFGLGQALEVGSPADLTVLDIESNWTVEPKKFLSQGKATPFAAMQLCGESILTMVNGRTVWEKYSIEK